MIEFANQQYFILFVLLPLIGLLYWWSKKRRVYNLSKFGNIKVLEHLMPDASKYMPIIKTSIMVVVVAILVIIICRPLINKKEVTITDSGNEVFIILDVSNSMLASSTDDINGTSRLDKSKILLEKMIGSLKNDRVGIIVFAGNAYLQLPMTSDFVSAKQYIDIISPEMAPTQGTAIAEAIELAMNSFTADKEKHKAIILITDSEDHLGEAVDMATEASKQNIQIDVVGLGNAKAMPIPIDSQKEEYLKDFNGETVYTALNEQLAQDIAKAGSGIYVNGNSSSAFQELNSQLKKLSKSELKTTKYNSASELFPIFVWIALVLLIVELFILDKKIEWLKDIKFFSK